MSGEELGINKDNLPQHIAIIMDGNGRWAKKRGLPRRLGHKAGADTFASISEYCKKIGIKYLTVYAFSTENWKRPKEEVDSIMKLLSEYLDKAFGSKEKGVKVKFIGERTKLSAELREKIDKIESVEIKNVEITVNIALNYGGRGEIVNATRQIAQEIKNGRMAPEDITEDTIQRFLYTVGQPDPDLIIRPSGEQRLSNFLIWQSAYTEFVFMDVLWPDFKPKDLEKAICLYQDRDRRFGGVQA